MLAPRPMQCWCMLPELDKGRWLKHCSQPRLKLATLRSRAFALEMFTPSIHALNSWNEIRPSLSPVAALFSRCLHQYHIGSGTLCHHDAAPACDAAQVQRNSAQRPATASNSISSDAALIYSCFYCSATCTAKRGPLSHSGSTGTINSRCWCSSSSTRGWTASP